MKSPLKEVVSRKNRLDEVSLVTHKKFLLTFLLEEK
jgi:hypothetical protein